MLLHSIYLLLLIPTLLAHIQELDWTLSYIEANPDNQKPCQIISINKQFPPPIIRLQKGDTLKIHLHNELDEDTALHFHGIFQRGTNQMDGPAMLTQCPIPPGSSFTYEFTVNQTGTYWYHAHESVQFGDGLRGVLVIEDQEKDNDYDEDVVISLSDWYYGKSEELLINKNGDEPRIDSYLFNDTRNVKWDVEPNKKYLIRLVNMGMSASQYFYIEDHTLTIVEIDGVDIEPIEVDSVMIATGQRYGVILQTKNEKTKNYGMVSVINMMMRKVYSSNWLVYDQKASLDPVPEINPRDLNYPDDLSLKPLDKTPKLGPADHQLHFIYDSMDYSHQNYWTMNGKPHLSPKVPTLMTVLSSNETEYNNSIIYGNSTNSFILQENEIVEIILNSNDMMKHPFHLHGHDFQVLARERKKHYDHIKEEEYSDFPMIRDTVIVPNHGYVVLRFKADNPGVWFFHCHTDWHAATGLGVVFIEAPDSIRKEINLSDQDMEICQKKGISVVGNAAGNANDFLNMTGDVSIFNIHDEQPNEKSVSMSSTTSKPSNVASSKIHNVSATQTTSSSTITSTFTSPSSTADTDAIPINTKIKVLIIYAIIMITITILLAIYINNKIRSTRLYKKRNSSMTYEPVSTEQ